MFTISSLFMISNSCLVVKLAQYCSIIRTYLAAGYCYSPDYPIVRTCRKKTIRGVVDEKRRERKDTILSPRISRIESTELNFDEAESNFVYSICLIQAFFTGPDGIEPEHFILSVSEEKNENRRRTRRRAGRLSAKTRMREKREIETEHT